MTNIFTAKNDSVMYKNNQKLIIRKRGRLVIFTVLNKLAISCLHGPFHIALYGINANLYGVCKFQ